jgi:hypothetical protein
MSLTNLFINPIKKLIRLDWIIGQLKKKSYYCTVNESGFLEKSRIHNTDSTRWVRYAANVMKILKIFPRILL